jgi:hypothetical protein
VALGHSKPVVGISDFRPYEYIIQHFIANWEYVLLVFLKSSSWIVNRWAGAVAAERLGFPMGSLDPS